MKKNGFFQSLLFRLVMLVMLCSAVACKKETKTNTAPSVFGGDIQYIFSPVDTCQLKGVAFDMENNVVSYTWKKILGPDSYVFEDAGALQTKISNLEVGDYQFELTVIDEEGLAGRDTAMVSVMQIGNSEIIIHDVPWNCAWDCSLYVPNFSYYVPPGTEFQVFIRINNSSDWFTSLPGSSPDSLNQYPYSVYENSLNISSYYSESGTSDIKLKF